MTSMPIEDVRIGDVLDCLSPMEVVRIERTKPDGFRLHGQHEGNHVSAQRGLTVDVISLSPTATTERLPAALAEVVEQKARVAAQDEQLAEKDAEIERLRALVESAYREGYADGYSDGLTDGHPLGGVPREDADSGWGISDTKEALR